MAQAAQREPSMEEILASIRKIIENNDSDRPEAAVERPEPSMAQAAPSPAPASAPVPRHSAPASFQSSPAAAPMQRAEAAGSDSSSVSLADIAARMRTDKSSAIGRVPNEPAVAEMEEALDDETVETGMRHEVNAEDGLEEVARAIASMTPELAQEMAAASERATEPRFRDDGAKAESAQSDEPRAEQWAKSETPAARPNGAASGLGQLISMEAGQKVARSFADLDAAITAGSQRSFDEIAEELLRPMLQTWLDDNLPTLVERLVREEIERVSRGTRG
ncbi:DUF2497 domain-containing protein [Pseudohoeflea suaedae]|uniref:DUF2497 domain-containing protein n=1 Tax=Pseudohoeflea suaedae TaxID=877384 RepID=A0A4V3A7L4_9HYPH|nr:DUF2497 domain-containing protein [Pseudohoeflea suaedae]TDH39175.1 DUF2497 domain-containing protein [Pseudohoeflea suaedae]